MVGAIRTLAFVSLFAPGAKEECMFQNDLTYYFEDLAPPIKDPKAIIEDLLQKHDENGVAGLMNPLIFAGTHIGPISWRMTGLNNPV